MNRIIKKARMHTNAALFLASLILLTGCQPAQPADTPNVQTSSLSAEPSLNSQGSSGNSSQAVSQIGTPPPEKQPQQTDQALALPKELSTSKQGYTVQLLTPAQYEAEYQGAYDGGVTGFPAVEVFFLNQGEQYALANRNGKFISDFIYENNEGWASAYGVVSVTKNGKSGLLDITTGEQLIPCEYDSVWVVGDSGFYQAVKGDLINILDRSGKVILELELGDSISAAGDVLLVQEDSMLKIYRSKDMSPVTNFACERFFIATQKEQNEEPLIAFESTGAWGIAKLNGEIVVEPIYDRIDVFYGDYTVFVQNGKFGLLKYDGSIALKPEWEDMEVDPTNPNTVRVCRDGQWGAITDIASKTLSIEPIYDFIGAFGEDGCAMFERKGRFGLLDKQGNEVLPAKYDTPVYSAQSGLSEGYYLLDGDSGSHTKGIISDGKVILSNDHSIWGSQISGRYTDNEPYQIISNQREKFGYIDPTGKIVIDTRFDKADGFIPGKEVAFVQTDGKICLIDRAGRIVLQTVFDDLIGYHADSMVGAFQYTDDKGNSKICLAKVLFP